MVIPSCRYKPGTRVLQASAAPRRGWVAAEVYATTSTPGGTRVSMKEAGGRELFEAVVPNSIARFRELEPHAVRGGFRYFATGSRLRPDMGDTQTVRHSFASLPFSLHPLLADLLDIDDALTLRLVKTDFIVATEHPIDGAYFTSRLSKAIDSHMSLGAELLRVAAIEGPRHRRIRSDGTTWLSVSDELPRVLRRLFVLEHGGEWVRWRPHLVIFRLICDEPLVLGEATFEHVSTRAGRQAFLAAPEAMRQLSVIGKELVVEGRQLMEGDDRLRDFGEDRFDHFTVLPNPSPLFPPDAFDRNNPPARYTGHDEVYRSLTCLVGVRLLAACEEIRNDSIRQWTSAQRDSACFRRCQQLLTAPFSGPVEGCPVFDCATGGLPDNPGHFRSLLLTNEVVDKEIVAELMVADGSSEGRDVMAVLVFTTELRPYTETRAAVMRVCGAELGHKVWEEEEEPPSNDEESDSDGDDGGAVEGEGLE